MDKQTKYLIGALAFVLIYVMWLRSNKSDDASSKTLGDTQATKVIWFHRPDCGYCVKMKDQWEIFEKLLGKTKVKPVKVDINQDKATADEYNVTGVPHIVKVSSDGTRSVYSGDRTAKDMLNWTAK
jgi:thiol-disulfide isomerase/thioredoxin